MIKYKITSKDEEEYLEKEKNKSVTTFGMSSKERKKFIINAISKAKELGFVMGAKVAVKANPKRGVCEVTGFVDKNATTDWAAKNLILISNGPPNNYRADELVLVPENDLEDK